MHRFVFGPRRDAEHKMQPIVGCGWLVGLFFALLQVYDNGGLFVKKSENGF